MDQSANDSSSLSGENSSGRGAEFVYCMAVEICLVDGNGRSSNYT